MFFSLWLHLNGPPLVPEFRFAPPRRWRADYAHLPSRVLIELEGGVWSGGRHVRGGGFIRDCEKYNAAAYLGWAVIRLATGMVDIPRLEELIDFIAERECCADATDVLELEEK